MSERCTIGAMAIEKHAREDLLRDARTFVWRAALLLPGDALSSSSGEGPVQVVVGFRAQGACSFYFGEDPVYQFTSGGELRRVFWEGRIIKAEGGRLCEAFRETAGGRVQLSTRLLSESEAARLKGEMSRRLEALAAAIEGDRFTLIGEVPEAGQVIPRTLEFLRRVPRSYPIASSTQVA